jgi:hypothetical protein
MSLSSLAPFSRPRKIARLASLNGSLWRLIWTLSADFADFGCVGG